MKNGIGNRVQALKKQAEERERKIFPVNSALSRSLGKWKLTLARENGKK